MMTSDANESPNRIGQRPVDLYQYSLPTFTIGVRHVSLLLRDMGFPEP
jgi:hypothetical protein